MCEGQALLFYLYSKQRETLSINSYHNFICPSFVAPKLGQVIKSSVGPSGRAV